MTAQKLVADLNVTEHFFERSTRCLTEEDSNFRPSAGVWTAAQQVAHVAHTVDWFVEGAGRPDGFDLDFEKHEAALKQITSLKESRRWVSEAFANARKFLEEKNEEDLTRPLPAGPVMRGMPMGEIVGAIIDHTAHHRGALTVYARLLGKTPDMPYGP